MTEKIIGYEFGPFRLDLTERSLFREGEPLPLSNKTIELLLVLIERRGQVLGKEELMNLLWPDLMVEESNLTQHIYSLRKALAEDRTEARYVQTVPRRGYRLIADVRELLPTPVAASDPVRAVAIRPGTRSGRLRPVIRVAYEYRKPLLTVLSFFCFLAVVAAFTKRYPRKLFSSVEITKLTNNGNVALIALSPDGESLAFSQGDWEDKQGIWLKQLANHSELALLPASAIDYQKIAYSRDGNYLYYIASPSFVTPGSLYRYALPGGPPVKLADNLNGSASFSPTGDRIAISRRNEAEGVSRIFLMNASGEGEPRLLASCKLPRTYHSTAWSPDGKTLAVAVLDRGESEEFMYVIAIEIASGRERVLTRDRWWRVTDLTWLGEESLAAVAMEQMTGFSQIWEIDWPSGERSRLTNDTLNYGRISASTDGRTLLTVESRVLTSIWITEAGQVAAEPKKILSGDYSGMHGLSATPDGRLLHTSSADGNWDIWSIDANGGPVTQLTRNAATNYMQTASPDGKSIVFASNRTGKFNIWRMDRDGKNPAQLTNGPGEGYPRLSPDGSWFLYTQGDMRNRSLWRRAVDGGAPVKLADRILPGAAISPDGRLVAYLTYEGHSGAIEVISADGGPVLHKFDVDTQNLQWRRDGKAISYVARRKDVSNIWDQPLDGSPPRQVTFFDSEYIFDFDWLPDGKRLACVRALPQNDVVRLRLRR
ncbi:MAG: winged helix-turn-helix domain-containing protein [Blastocatellia bacterium]|nr:winged helix-turn-helix domain-containing protein [Blastocatellia bacterium]